MNVIRRIWMGIVAAIAGVALAVLVQVAGQMALGFQIDYLKWTVWAFSAVGFLPGFVIGPRSTKATSRSTKTQK